MAKTVNQDVNSVGLYTPYHTRERGGADGLVGTLYVDGAAVGDATGGALTIQIRMRRQEFGFPLIWVPTVIVGSDNLAAAEAIQFSYDSTGNRRIDGGLVQTVLAVRSIDNAAVMQNVSVPIEGVSDAQAVVFGTIWPSNTDTKVYHLHMFGPVFDLQVIARQGDVDVLLAGMR